MVAEPDSVISKPLFSGRTPGLRAGRWRRQSHLLADEEFHGLRGHQNHRISEKNLWQHRRTAAGPAPGQHIFITIQVRVGYDCSIYVYTYKNYNY